MFHTVRGNDVIPEYDVAYFPLERKHHFQYKLLKNGKIRMVLFFILIIHMKEKLM